MSSSSDENNSLMQEGELKQVSNAKYDFLQEESREKYLKNYNLFNQWRRAKGAETFSETVLLSYFMELSETRQPNTLWSIYSMLKAVIKTKRHVDIERYTKLVAFIKKKNVGHKPNKSKVFTASDIDKFLNEAPDYNFLGLKVILIIGINGRCHSNELLNLKVNDIEKHSDKLILVNLNTKSKNYRSFVIRDEYVNFIDRYMALRPAETTTNRFFLRYINGKCTVQPMGINRMVEVPRKIATFLELQDPHLYTGHCLRRTSATLTANSGLDLNVLKPRKSSTIEDDCTESKLTISKSNTESISLKTLTDMSRPSTSRENVNEDRPVSPRPECSLQITNIKTETTPDTQVNNITITFSDKTVTLNLNNCSNFSFNIQK